MMDSSWVQTGELGIAFVMLILATGLVRYVLRTSGERETKLLDIVEKIAPALEVIIDKLDDFDERLEKVEKAVGVGHKKNHRGLALNDD